MEKKDIIDFFDRCAPSWDAEMVKDDEIIDTILKNAEVKEGLLFQFIVCHLARGRNCAVRGEKIHGMTSLDVMVK